MAKRHSSSRPAFTLLELVLVLVVIAIALGVAAPSLRGWSHGARLRDTAEQFMTLARQARTQAIAKAQVHRLTLDSGKGRCVVSAQDGQQWMELDRGMGGSFDIPEGVTIQMTDPQGARRDFIEFYPNSRTQAVRVRFSMADGQVDIECTTPTEGFRVLASGEAR